MIETIEMPVPISKLGPYQIQDIERSSGITEYDCAGRICEVLKNPGSFDERFDDSPRRMAELFGKGILEYNYHYVIQAADCPLRCPYCYVDNLAPNLEMDARQIVDNFEGFKQISEEEFSPSFPLNVLHFMGGCPGKYCEFWPELREELDSRELGEVILYTDVILLENHFFSEYPWEYMDLHHFLVAGNLKGLNKKEFKKNTGGFDLYETSMAELEEYVEFTNFYVTISGTKKKKKDYKRLVSMVKDRQRITEIQLVDYEVVKARREGLIK